MRRAIMSIAGVLALTAVAGAATSWKLPRQVIVHGSGNLVYTNENGTTITLPVTAPYTYDIAPRTLEISTATNVLVLW